MTCEQVLQIVRSKLTAANTPDRFCVLGHRLDEFIAEEQVQILLWVVEREKHQNWEYRKAMDELRNPLTGQSSASQ